MFEVHGFTEDCGCQWCVTAVDIISGGAWVPATDEERVAMLAELEGTMMPGSMKEKEEVK